MQLLQPAGHVVELIGQRLDLVAGLDGDALAEIAEPIRAAPARNAWIGTTMRRGRNMPAGRRAPARRGAQSRALDRGIEGRVGLLDRRFDEDEPAERGDRRKGGEHLVALDIGRLLHLLGGVAGRSGPRAPHLRQPRHIGVAQDEADVGMGDQSACGIDHVGAAVPGEFDLRQHVPDELQIDFGDATPVSRRVPANESVIYGSDSRRK